MLEIGWEADLATRHGVTVDDNGDAALHGAVMRGSPELVLYLLERGAALDPVNERGWTPLTIAQGIFCADLWRRWLDMEALLLDRRCVSCRTRGERR